jgi:exonuclease SbcD
VIVVAHAFVTGGHASDSERDVRVGGIPDAPVAIFDGANYVALGHLHRPQEVKTQSQMQARYSGSPIAYSFSEEGQHKSVVLIEVNNNVIEATLLPTPQPRGLATIRGELEELLSNPALAPLEEHWIRAVITDERRPDRPMDRIRERFPHALQLEFLPANGGAQSGVRAVDTSVLNPGEVTTSFIEYVSGSKATDIEIALIEQAVERVRLNEVK